MAVNKVFLEVKMLKREAFNVIPLCFLRVPELKQSTFLGVSTNFSLVSKGQVLIS